MRRMHNENEKGRIIVKQEQEQAKQIDIELKDERNITLGNAAKARVYELMMWLIAGVIVALVFTKLISLAAFFILLAVFAACQCYFIFRLCKYHKET